MAAKRSTRAPAAPAPTSTLAVVSLIAGVMGFTLFPVAGSLIAVVTGLLARREIDAAGGALQGDGLALAGEVLGGIGIALSLLGLCLVGSVVAFSLCLGLFAAEADRTSALLPVILSLL
jgi:dihydroorotate dehydrogenase